MGTITKEKTPLASIPAFVDKKSSEGSYPILFTKCCLKGNVRLISGFELQFSVSISRKLIVSEGCSLFASINGWTQGVMGILDSIFGMPLTHTSTAARTKLEDERAR